MSRRGLRLLFVACVLPALWLVTKSFLDVSLGLLFLVPAVLLALPLIAGRYVGAERLIRAAGQRRPAACRCAPVVAASRPRRRVPPRGGLLIAASLAVRPPPPVIST